jgi:superfamily II DNA helicase RecQ
MQIQIFSIPMEGDDEAVAQLNLFLRTHKVLCVEKAPVVAQGRQFWSVCVEYMQRRAESESTRHGSGAGAGEKPKTDYRQLLSTAEFARFSKLRQLRKQLADSEAVPVYALFTNAQLAELARRVPKSKAALAEVEGIGEAKIQRYGTVLLGVLGSMPDPEPAQPSRVAPANPAEAPADSGLAATGVS